MSHNLTIKTLRTNSFFSVLEHETCSTDSAWVVIQFAKLSVISSLAVFIIVSCLCQAFTQWLARSAKNGAARKVALRTKPLCPIFPSPVFLPLRPNYLNAWKRLIRFFHHVMSVWRGANPRLIFNNRVLVRLSFAHQTLSWSVELFSSSRNSQSKFWKGKQKCESFMCPLVISRWFPSM